MAVTDLYNAEFMDHVSHPDYKYQMEDPDCTHEGVNPSCGDELNFSVKFADDGTIMSDLMIDKKPEEAIRLCKLFMQMVRGEIPEDDPSLADLEDASILKDIAHMPARVKCAELAWRTLEEMLENK